jgi:hypothetical protein
MKYDIFAAVSSTGDDLGQFVSMGEGEYAPIDRALTENNAPAAYRAASGGFLSTMPYTRAKKMIGTLEGTLGAEGYTHIGRKH